MEFEAITEKVIGCAYQVYNRMDFGFLESVYVNYLVAMKMDVGLILNFGERGVEVKRKVRTLK